MTSDQHSDEFTGKRGDIIRTEKNYSVLVFGYGDVVKNKYKVDMPARVQDGVAYVELKAIANSDDKVLEWGSDALTQFIEDQSIATFIIATTPQSHKLIIEYLLATVSNLEARIIVEKPFLPSTALFTDVFSNRLKAKSNLTFYCIDHYIGKPVVGWLGENIADLVSHHGKVTGIRFRSFEKKSFGNPDTFSAGYAIEHGVHALPCFESILGPLVSSVDMVDIDNTSVEFHELEGLAIINKFDFHFSVVPKSRSGGLLAPRIKLAIAGGKMHVADEKTLTIIFEGGEMVCGINSNAISVNGVKQDVAGLDKERAYSRIFKSIFGSEVGSEVDSEFDSEVGVKSYAPQLLRPEDAMRSVALMEAGVADALSDSKN